MYITSNMYILTLAIEFLNFIVTFYYFINKNNILKILTTSLIYISISIFLSIHTGAISYFFLCTLLTLSNLSNSSKKIISSLLFSILIICIHSLIYTPIYNQFILSKINNSFIILSIYFFIFLIIDLITLPFLKKIYSKYLSVTLLYSDKIDKIITPMLSILLIGLLTIISMIQLTNTPIYYNLSTIAIIFIIILILFVIFIIKSINHTKKIFIREKEIEDVNQLISYTKQLEIQQQQLRKFKHDYLNILLSLQSAIESENISQIKNTFNKINKYSNNILNDYSTNISDLGNIKNLPIKSIFLSKFLQWEEITNKHIFFECSDEITDFEIDDIILIRILGNLLDNAYEEIIQQNVDCQRFINIAIINEDDTIEIIIENSLLKPIQHFHHLSANNVSSKENHSGFGLSTVKTLVNENNNLSLCTNINNKKLIFSISLIIEKEC